MTTPTGDTSDPHEFTRQRDQVLAALDRLAAGTFARCDVCGVQISNRRLRLAPAADRCVNHLLPSSPEPRPDHRTRPGTQPDQYDPASPDEGTNNDGSGDDRDH
ncbi:TraR/DksA family transcriptional regulator [Pseudonocardia endophytica]|uniref:Uncharacterized protein n=1 Tax=Pseudonocardia endophytica TaxID=401976 RepID=A0A4R1HPZ1_PSEEN|nr:TraR/DksA C4-type zinc finger protein [Pseudonocardia endophytica]TCK24634.1 hypothetical protein EV378_0410 [Pseudonocardia endophytica]